MLSTNSVRGVISKPMLVQIPALGLESTTTRMQQCGWDFSAEQDVRMMALNVIARHNRARLYFLSQMDMDYHRALEDHSYLAGRPLVFNMVDSRMVVPHVPPTMFANYEPVDMMPSFSREPVVSMEDLKIFAAAPLARTNEIIVEEREVKDLLADILSKQEDGRQEHFRKMLRQNREGMVAHDMPQVKFHAQILSVA